MKKYRYVNFISFVLSFILIVAVCIATSCDEKPLEMEETQESSTEGSITAVSKDTEEVAVTEPIEIHTDPYNTVYPYNTMSADWGAELYESGFTYYQIPQAYIIEGGCLPEIVQAYLWLQCKERGVNYYVALALIEVESGYEWDALGGGISKGYMQIYEKYNLDRMATEGVDDLYNPYGNIRVGLNLLQELVNKYGSENYHYILMCYNMGELGCKKSISNGIYSTVYSRKILNRAQEIEQELQG